MHSLLQQLHNQNNEAFQHEQFITLTRQQYNSQPLCITERPDDEQHRTCRVISASQYFTLAKHTTCLLCTMISDTCDW